MMIYFLRHQAGGVLLEYPFERPPTEAQIAPLLAEMRRLHGETSPKGNTYWWRVVEYKLIGDEIPQTPAVRPAAPPPSLPMFEIGGEGTVTPPKG